MDFAAVIVNPSQIFSVGDSPASKVGGVAPGGAGGYMPAVRRERDARHARGVSFVNPERHEGWLRWQRGLAWANDRLQRLDQLLDIGLEAIFADVHRLSPNQLLQ